MAGILYWCGIGFLDEFSVFIFPKDASWVQVPSPTHYRGVASSGQSYEYGYRDIRGQWLDTKGRLQLPAPYNYSYNLFTRPW